MAVVLLLQYPAEVAVEAWAGNLRLTNGLPLHLCDVVGTLTAIALLNRNQTCIELVYFGGLAGTLQGLATPSLSFDFPHPAYFRFFALHSLVVISALYLTWGQRHYPRRGAYLFTFFCLNIYVVVAGLANWVLGTNYGYLCEKPAAASIMNFLPPWPWYLLVLEVIAIAILFVLDLPFRRLRSGERNRERPPASHSPTLTA
jgi:hypothetical integral membrane protein (TIGR02206 family)